MKRLPWKYLAGLIDGEGCIDVQVTKQVYVRPRLRIQMSVRANALIEPLQNTYQGSSIHVRTSTNPNWSDAYTISWDGYSRCCGVLRNVANHLNLKREEARLCLWMETHIKGKHVSTEVRDAIREELKLMKRDPHRLSVQAQERIITLL